MDDVQFFFDELPLVVDSLGKLGTTDCPRIWPKGLADGPAQLLMEMVRLQLAVRKNTNTEEEQNVPD